MDKVACEVPGCENKLKSKGYCSGHNNQWRRGEVPAPVAGAGRSGSRRFRGPSSLEEFFWMRVEKTETCWLWRGKKTVDGYPQIKFRDIRAYAHRFSWELVHGPIPEGNFIDHLCHTPGCVNPGHLRSVAPKGNSENRQGAAKHSKSGIRGVYFDPESGKWRAEVRHRGRRVNIGRFESLDDAAEAARVKRSELFPVSN